MTGLGQRRFLFVTGKGGVGKTTVTCALGLALARTGKRVLLVASDAKERISWLLGATPLGPEITSLAEGLSGLRPDPMLALREYGELVLKSRTLSAAVFDGKLTRGFFAGVPGLTEWAVLGKAWFHATEELAGGRPRFDVVLFDAPATGHGLDMLRVPKVIVDLVPPGVLRRDAEAAWALFRDPERGGVVVVTLPEEMPTNETLELLAALESELSLPVASLVVNAVLAPAFSGAERARLLEPREFARTGGDTAISAGVRRAIRERIQEEAQARLARTGLPTLTLPRLFRDAANREAVEELSRRFDALLG